MNLALDFEPSRKQPPNWPGPVALLGLGLIIALIIFCTSCSSRFYYPNGQIKASIQGDLTYTRSADGDEKLEINHSSVIREGNKGIVAAGSAVGTFNVTR